MIKYHTDKYGRYNGRQSQARRNPNYTPDTHDISAKYHYNPRRESLLEPETVGANEAHILVDREWIKVIDRIHQYYYDQDGTKHTITELDIDIPDGCIQDDPITQYYETHDGSVWIENTVKKEADESETLRIEEIDTEQSNSGLKRKTVAQARAKIDQIFSGATTVAALRAACIQAFKIIVTFILK